MRQTLHCRRRCSHDRVVVRGDEGEAVDAVFVGRVLFPLLLDEEVRRKPLKRLLSGVSPDSSLLLEDGSRKSFNPFLVARSPMITLLADEDR
jgi:hypothetical protein